MLPGVPLGLCHTLGFEPESMDSAVGVAVTLALNDENAIDARAAMREKSLLFIVVLLRF